MVVFTQFFFINLYFIIYIFIESVEVILEMFRPVRDLQAPSRPPALTQNV